MSWAEYSAWGLTRPEPRCQLAWAFIWRLWGKINLEAHSGGWPTSVPCRSEVPVSLLAVGQGLGFAPPGCLLLSHSAPVTFSGNGGLRFESFSH